MRELAARMNNKSGQPHIGAAVWALWAVYQSGGECWAFIKGKGPTPQRRPQQRRQRRRPAQNGANGADSAYMAPGTTTTRKDAEKRTSAPTTPQNTGI